MRKQILICMCVVCLILTATNCGSYYTINTETTPTQSLSAYKTIHVGWLDMNEDNFKTYGYETKEAWAKVIEAMNIQQLPGFLKEFLPGKIVTTAKSKSEGVADGVELYIKFSNAQYSSQTSSTAQVFFGRLAGSDTLDCTIHFIDVKTNTEIYKVDINFDSKAGSAYSSMGFEGRVTNTVYNMAYFLGEKLTN